MSRVNNQALEELEKQIDRLQKQINIEKQVHQSSADFLRRKANQLQEEMLHWMQKHENDTQSKDAEIESLKNIHQRYPPF